MLFSSCWCWIELTGPTIIRSGRICFVGAHTYLSGLVSAETASKHSFPLPMHPGRFLEAADDNAKVWAVHLLTGMLQAVCPPKVSSCSGW